MNFLSEPPVRLDLTKSEKAKVVTLYSGMNFRNISLISNQLSPSVVTCNLHGYFAKGLDWQSFTSQLIELTLSVTDSIISLQGRGLDQIRILKLFYLPKVTSLAGLGGKNKKVSIIECHQITDFTALRAVDTVTIESCKKFIDVSQVNEVRVLEISPIDGELINLDSLGSKTEILTILSENVILSADPTLFRIPHLVLDHPGLELEAFLSHGERFNNQSITILFTGNFSEMKELCKKYCPAEYDFFAAKDSRFMRLLRKRL